MPNLVDQPKASSVATLFTRKVWAMIWTLLGAIALLVILLVLRARVLPDVSELDMIISALGGSIPVLITAIIAAYRVRERDAPAAGGT